MIRLLFVLLTILFYVLISIVFIPIDILLQKIFKIDIKNFCFKFTKIIMKSVLFVSGVKVDIKNKSLIKELDSSTPLLIISNHRGFFDIIIGFCILECRVAFVAKDSFKKIPFFSYYMRRIGCFFLDRQDVRSGMQMIMFSINSIKEGVPIWICPEGTRNKNLDPKELLEFKSGTFKIAEKTGCKILPIAFLNTEECFEKHFPKVSAINVKVNIGEPYSFASKNINDCTEMAEYSKANIEDLLDSMI